LRRRSSLAILPACPAPVHPGTLKPHPGIQKPHPDDAGSPDAPARWVESATVTALTPTTLPTNGAGPDPGHGAVVWSGATAAGSCCRAGAGCRPGTARRPGLPTHVGTSVRHASLSSRRRMRRGARVAASTGYADTWCPRRGWSCALRARGAAVADRGPRGQRCSRSRSGCEPRESQCPRRGSPEKRMSTDERCSACWPGGRCLHRQRAPTRPTTGTSATSRGRRLRAVRAVRPGEPIAGRTLSAGGSASRALGRVGPAAR
jgi:hypothetical protein